MFGLGKRNCKLCDRELADMEALGDRVDDLMPASSLSADGLHNICATCRVGLSKSGPSAQARRHVIEAARIDAQRLETDSETIGENIRKTQALATTPAPATIPSAPTTTERHIATTVWSSDMNAAQTNAADYHYTSGDD